MNWNYLISIIFLAAILLAGCIEVEEEEVVTTTTTIAPTTTTTTTLITTTTTSPITTTTVTSTTLVFTCADYCKREGYKEGKCRRTPARCKIYGINEIYKPLGNRYCPKGTGYNACCCIFSVTTTSIATSTTLPAQKE